MNNTLRSLSSLEDQDLESVHVSDVKMFSCCHLENVVLLVTAALVMNTNDEDDSSSGCPTLVFHPASVNAADASVRRSQISVLELINAADESRGL